MTEADDVPRKRLLFLAADFPLPIASGSQIRQMNLLKALARHFDVTFVTPSMQDADLDHIPEIERYASRVVAVRPDNKRGPLRRLFFKIVYWLRRYTVGDSKDRFYNAMPSITRAVQRELRRQPHDILFTIYWYWDARIWNTTAHKVIDANDVQSHRVQRLLERTGNPLERLLKDWLLRRYRQMEAETLRRADLIVAITERDRREFDEMTGGTVEQIVIPTGLDTDHFQPQGEPRPQHIGFFGALRNPMNRDAVVHLIDDIWPVLKGRFPELTLSLIGAGAPPEVRERVARHPEISLTGYVEDIRDPISRCQAILLPLRIGWGIRGRVYEVLSLGVPVIASPVAVDGMDLPEDDGIVLASQPEDVAAALQRILEDPEHRRQMGQRGRRLAVQQASFAATYDRLAQFLARRW